MVATLKVQWQCTCRPLYGTIFRIIRTVVIIIMIPLLLFFVCNWTMWGCRRRGGTERTAGGRCGSAASDARRETTLTALHGHASEKPECTQNAASTSCDKPLHVKKIKKQPTVTPEAPSSRLKPSRRQCICRRNHLTRALADALELCMNPSVRLPGPGQNRAALTTVCGGYCSWVHLIRVSTHPLAPPSGWR